MSTYAASAMLDPTDLDADTDVFVGSEHGGLALSSLVLPPGGGRPRMRRRPYPTVFVIGAGQATFRVGDETVVAGPGQMVVAPPHVPHGYANSGDGELRLTAIQIAEDG